MKGDIKKEDKYLLIIGMFYIVYILLFISKFDFNVSSTIEFSYDNANNPHFSLPKNLIIHQTDGFDGQNYYLMALGLPLEKISMSPHFLQRVFYPFLSKTLALGKINIIPYTMLLINFASIIISSFFVLKILKRYNYDQRYVFLWAFNVGFMICIIRNLTEPLMCLFVISGFYYFLKKRHVLSSFLLSLALITRELALTTIIALILFLLYKKKIKTSIIYLLSLIPFSYVQYYLYKKTGELALLISYYSVEKPFVGFFYYIQKIPIYFYKFIIKPILNISSTQSSLYSNAKVSYTVFSILPLIIFIIIMIYFIFYYVIKEKRLSILTFLLSAEILLMLSFKPFFFTTMEIDAIGRYAILLFLFSMLFLAEKRKKFPWYLSALMIILSIMYFIIKIIIFNPGYIIT